MQVFLVLEAAGVDEGATTVEEVTTALLDVDGATVAELETGAEVAAAARTFTTAS